MQTALEDTSVNPKPEKPSQDELQNTDNKKPENTKQPGTIKTGDNAKIGIIVGCMAVAVITVGIVLIFKKKRRS